MIAEEVTPKEKYLHRGEETVPEKKIVYSRDYYYIIFFLLLIKMWRRGKEAKAKSNKKKVVASKIQIQNRGGGGGGSGSGQSHDLFFTTQLLTTDK